MSHEMLTQTDLAKRWGVDRRTVNKWVAENKLKPNKVTGMFPLAYVEAFEAQDIDLETVSAFRLRALEKENEQLRDKVAMLTSTLYQVAVTANEVAAKLANEMAG